ncbi:nucleoside hydrolase [Rathayibacter sp. AY1F3]|uniref:nucleoside hydrolase n=1 Tax=Rathayibacter sp. AY1F3 TaxID=2080558 RepID=UPI000CE8E733|nr:nucleoside hydrolase [Rathayibacter sp. AY1F3]PPG92864.1 nucleoside hydrolase [Rathayibacter sp. AY1F3]
MNGHPLFIDCDTGIDDALAIAYLVAAGADIVGIGTVSGNTSAAQAARNTLDLLDLLGAPAVPVAIGAADFTTRPFSGGAPDVHGRNGIGDVQLPSSGRPSETGDAGRLLSALAREHPGRLRILALGPLTNLATAVARDPDLPALIESVTIMGGAASAPGNVTPAAEANIHNDPEAASAVLGAGWNITLVPLDVTMEQRITAGHCSRLRATGAASLTALADMLEYYFDFYGSRFPERSAALHDPLAAAVAIGAVTSRSAPRAPVTIDHSDGPGRGQTIVDLRGRYSGYADQAATDPRILLTVEGNFGDALTDLLVTAFVGESQSDLVKEALSRG